MFQNGNPGVLKIFFTKAGKNFRKKNIIIYIIISGDGRREGGRD